MADRQYYKEIYDVKNWLSAHLTQLSYTRNLVLTMSFATLGYTLNEFTKIKANLNSYERIIWVSSAILLLVSIGTGLLISVFEARNYRNKRKISRIILKDSTFDETNPEFNRIQVKCNDLEKYVRDLFRIQILCLFVSFIVLSYLFLK